MFKGYLYIISIIAFISACDPCDDCDQVTFEPTIELSFINADSLAKIARERTELAAISATLNEQLEEVDGALDSLNRLISELNDRIANGENLEAEKEAAESEAIKLSAQRLEIVNETDSLSLRSTSLATAASLINSGSVFVSSIEVLETNSSLTYEDSATSFLVPVSLDRSFFNYAVTIFDSTNLTSETNTFELDYELFREVDGERNLLIRAENIRVVEYSFDSLDACFENCIDGEARFTFYF